MAPSFDAVIAGGGPAGGALALALRAAGLSVIVIEARPAGQDSEDPRPVALSYGSRLLLESLGLWSAVDPVTPIARIHVSQRGGFGRVMLDARDIGQPALGYVVDYAQLAGAVTGALRDARCTLLAGTRVTGATVDAECVNVSALADAESIQVSGNLLVIADGGTLSDPAAMQTIDYRQTAITARVLAEVPHGNVAYERFCPEGPLALLPSGDQLALVWTTTPERAQQLCAAPDPDFLAALGEAFGRRLGRFRAVERRGAFPLVLRRAHDIVAPRTVRIGNASQTLHPFAGQGFNLALRDACELAAALRRAPPRHIGDAQTLASYAARRRIDRFGELGITHGMVRLFAGDAAPLRWARGLGLAALAATPPARNFLARRMIYGARG